MKVIEASRGTARRSPSRQTLAFETPERLMIDTWDPEPEAGRISVKSQPTMTFTQPIRDRKAAVAALSLEPARPRPLGVGRRQDGPLRADRRFAVRHRDHDQGQAGPTGARSTTGSYFENEAILEYLTEADKLIDVDVTTPDHDALREGQGGPHVQGWHRGPGADTPIGDFTVEYKMPTARFQGTNVGGVRYDIPDVKWVLAFMGDYTIHGVYWRGNFGEPGSNGCVGLTDEDAKILFDWAPKAPGSRSITETVCPLDRPEPGWIGSIPVVFLKPSSPDVSRQPRMTAVRPP